MKKHLKKNHKDEYLKIIETNKNENFIDIYKNLNENQSKFKFINFKLQESLELSTNYKSEKINLQKINSSKIKNLYNNKVDKVSLQIIQGSSNDDCLNFNKNNNILEAPQSKNYLFNPIIEDKKQFLNSKFSNIEDSKGFEQLLNESYLSLLKIEKGFTSQILDNYNINPLIDKMKILIKEITNYDENKNQTKSNSDIFDQNNEKIDLFNFFSLYQKFILLQKKFQYNMNETQIFNPLIQHSILSIIELKKIVPN